MRVRDMSGCRFVSGGFALIMIVTASPRAVHSIFSAPERGMPREIENALRKRSPRPCDNRPCHQKNPRPPGVTSRPSGTVLPLSSFAHGGLGNRDADLGAVNADGPLVGL